jgi:hypothetical protein
MPGFVKDKCATKVTNDAPIVLHLKSIELIMPSMSLKIFCVLMSTFASVDLIGGQGLSFDRIQYQLVVEGFNAYALVQPNILESFFPRNCLAIKGENIHTTGIAKGPYLAFIRRESPTSRFCVPRLVESIYDGAFSHLTADGLAFEFLSCISEIGDEAFSYTKILSFYLPGGVGFLGERVFSYSDIYCFTFGLDFKLDTLPPYFFSYTKQLTLVQLPDCIEAISESCFFRSSIQLLCRSEDSLLKCIGPRAFCRSGLQLFDFSRISAFGSKAFSHSGLLTADFSLCQSTVELRYCKSLTSVTLPPEIQLIKPEAFCRCSSLQSIFLPGSLRNVGEQCFLGTTIRSLCIPSLVIIMGRGALYILSLEIVTCERSDRPRCFSIDVFRSVDHEDFHIPRIDGAHFVTQELFNDDTFVLILWIYDNTRGQRRGQIGLVGLGGQRGQFVPCLKALQDGKYPLTATLRVMLCPGSPKDLLQRIQLCIPAAGSQMASDLDAGRPFSYPGKNENFF